jgi:hypothetical protein
MQYQQSPERTQRLIEHMKDLWNQSQPIDADHLQKIIQFVQSLPEQYKQIGLTKIAEYTTAGMSMHLLSLMAIFQQCAEQEGISAEDVKDTFDHILPEAFRILPKLGKKIQVQSLDDLVALANITVNLQILSLSDNAENAQNWLYELPDMYYQQLSQEKLIGNKPIERISVETNTPHKSTGWIFQSNQGYTSPDIRNSKVRCAKDADVA